MANKLFFESFDHPNWSYDKLWTSKNGSEIAVGATPGRNGNGLLFSTSVDAGNHYVKWLGKNLGEYVPQMVLGFAFKLPSSASAGFWIRRWETLCQFQSQDYSSKYNLWLLALADSSAGTTFRLAGRMFDATNGVDWIYDSGDAIDQATSAISLAVDTWYYIEVDVLFGVSGGGHMKVYVDGELAIDATDIKTVNSSVGGTAWGSFLLGGTGISNVNQSAYTYGYFDDVYCHYGDSPTRLGDLTVENKVIGAEAISTSWSAYPSGTAATNVTDNDAATGISSSVVDDQHLFTFGDISATPETIHGVQVCAIGQKTDSGARNLALVAHERWYSGVLTASALIANDTVSIGYSGSEVVYTFKASPTVAYEVAVGGDLEESLTNLATAINEGDANGGVAHPLGTATSDATTLTFLANAGLNGALILTTETASDAAWDDAQLTQYNDADASADLPMSANTKSFIHTFAVDPRTSTGWTKSRLNNAFVGVKCR